MARSLPTVASSPQTPTQPPLAPDTHRLLDAPVLASLLRLAAPNIVVVAVQAASSSVDAFYVSQLGPATLAGVALVFPSWMLMVTMSAGGIGIGISSAVARALGGGRRAEAASLAAHACVIGLTMAGLFTAGMLLSGPLLYRALGGTGAAFDAALAYSNVVFAGATAVWIVNTLASILRGGGEMLLPALVVVVGELAHVLLAPVLIFGLGPMPRLGVAGAGLSLVIVSTARALALGAYLVAGRSSVPLTLAGFRLDAAQWWEILRVGLPGSINTLLTTLNVLAITGLVGSFGTLALAGYGLAARLEYLLIPLVFGLGTALVTLVGTSVGAGRLARARRAAWTGAGLAATVTGGVGGLVAAQPLAWLGIFSADPDVLAAGAAYLRIAGPAYALNGLGLVLYFALQGAGRPLWPLLAGLGRLLVAVGGAWLAVGWLGGDLRAVSGAVALGFAASAATLSLATARLLRSQ
jgi:putative MATE family efflux protein